MKKIIPSGIILLLIWYMTISQGIAENFQKAPAKIRAAILVKLLAFDRKISEKERISLYIIGDAELAREIRKLTSIRIGKATLADVNEGDELPTRLPDAIYIDNAEKSEKILAYTRKNKILSITGISELVSKGVTLGIVISSQKPRILLNISASQAEHIDWNPAILKVSTTIQ